MKSSRSWFVPLAGILLAALAARADLPRWLQDLRFAPRYDGVFATPVRTASGIMLARRPPREARQELTRLIANTPGDAGLYALRARSAEEQLDPVAAEADWIEHARLSADPAAGQLALADFYHRRLRPPDEMRALEAAAEAPLPAAEGFLPAASQRPWRICERMVALASAQALPADAAYRVWIRLYAKERTVYQRHLDDLVAKKQFAAAEQALAAYRKAFSDDAVYPVTALARLEQSRGSAAQALAVYDNTFTPLWPADLVKNYFALLSAQHHLSAFVSQARAALAADPANLGAATRIFYYYQQQANLPAARRVLIEFRQRRDAGRAIWTANDLWTLGSLLEAVHDYDEAARCFHGVYALPAAGAADRERALGALVRLLFSASEQPIGFGANDLSYYKDIAAMDPHPGFLNGILSLLLNSTGPEWRYTSQEQASVAYFHRARAAELLALFDAKFPNSPLRPALRAQLVETYATYSENDAVIRTAREFLAAFPSAPERTNVALRMAEAHARKRGESVQEFAVYDALLKELAARAGGVPLGVSDAGSAQSGEQPDAAASGARNPDYARVLDRYLSRLVAMKRPLDALRVLRGELDRNPNDPGIYARLAAFLEQNKLDAEIEQVYRRAIQQFSSISWYDRLGRWYVRRNMHAQLGQLTRQVIDTFSGTGVERYLTEVRTGPPTLYRDINLYAHERFPYDLVFVRNLLSAYTTRGTADAAAYERLLREYWSHADDLRSRFFERLSSSGRLDAELKSLPPATPAAARFAAEGEAWRSHFETASAGLEAAAAEFPADASLALRAASLDRSLSAFDPAYTARAVEIVERLHKFDLRDRAALTRMGEIFADREDIAHARPLWNQIPRIEPGNPEGYLEAATIFWDYFQFDDALRLIEQARTQTGNPALYAYEAGAVYESKRDEPRAVAEYLKGAGAGGSARSRLVTLARRPAHRDLIDKLTAGRVAATDPSPEALSLRIAVLDAQGRRAEVTALLAAIASRATTVDVIANVRAEGEARGADDAVERALEREAAVTPDPLDRMRARLSLMRFHEARRRTEPARAIVEKLYGENPAILGVVRATVDFHWRNAMPKQAVDTLAAAAASSNPSFRKQFTLEAATKATTSGDYPRAREFTAALLKEEPFRPDYVAAMASIFAAERDDRGLRDFYQERIEAVRAAPFAPAELTSRIAALRRNLIPVLARQNDHTAASDQYIEILRAYPEDESLAREAALYASAHGMRERMLAWFNKAAADSPRDARWPILLARIQTALEDLPAAIDAYSRASAIRPERADLLTARTALEERLMRFEAALAGYVKLYDLTYRNPQWMEKAAEMHARLGHKDEAVKALRVAFLEGRPERAQAFFDIARILDSWDLPAEARPFAERGVVLAGDGILTEHGRGAAIYARVMTRLRAHEIAIERLYLASKSESDDFDNAATAAGDAAGRYFTPEEKAALEAFLEKEKALVPPKRLFDLVQRAGMSALEAKWRFDELMAKPERNAERFIELQRSRMKNDELGVQLEALWQAGAPTRKRDQYLNRAAEAFRDARNPGAELRILTLLQGRSALSGPPLQRYFELLAVHAPARLVAEASGASTVEHRDLAANTALASGKTQLAFDAIRARGQGLTPVWMRAYTGLAGVYFSQATPDVSNAFTALLGDAPIGARLGKPVDRNQQLAGARWFYYGTVFGEYLSFAKSGDPEDYLPALLEGTPARAGAYATLADRYRENRSFDKALADYARALELDPTFASLHDRMAVILWDANRRDDAVAHWKAAFAAFRKLEDGRLAESFWADFPAALENAGSRNLLAAVRTEADSALRTYFRRNGAYRAQPLIDAALSAAAGSAEGVEWIIGLSRVAPNPLEFLDTAVQSRRLAPAQREVLYQRILSLAESDAAQPGPEHAFARDRLRERRMSWVAFLLDNQQAARARTAISTMPDSAQKPLPADLALLELRAAVQMGELPKLLESWTREPERIPSFDTLLAAAAYLKQAANSAVNRLLEFAYTRELERQNLAPSNFLGLAEIRLQENNPDGALALLRRMTLVSGEPFENLVPAAALLEKTGHLKEAREFRAARAKAVPWDLDNRAAMGEAAVARSPLASYAVRLAAAGLAHSAGNGSGELDLLAANERPAPAAAEHPYFYAARLAAAEAASAAGIRLRLLSGAVAIDPTPAPPRLSLFRAAFAANQPHTALAAIRPLLPRYGMLEVPDQEPQGGGSYNYYAGAFLSEGFDTAQRAEVARGCGSASVAIGELGRAVAYFLIAQEIEPSAQTESALAEVRAERRLRAANARRRPVVNAELEQANLVQPKLAPPVPSRPTGGTSR